MWTRSPSRAQPRTPPWTVREIDIEAAASLPRVPHARDEEPWTLHLGAFDGAGALVGALTAWPASPDGGSAPNDFQLYGPFGEGGDLLVDRFVEAHLSWGGRVWADSPRAGLPEIGEGRFELVVPEPPQLRPEVRGPPARLRARPDPERLRAQPDRFVPGRGAPGVAALLRELLASPVEDHLDGRVRTLRVQLDPAGITVADDGDGLPVDESFALLQQRCTELSAGIRRRTALGRSGLVVPCALSALLVITVDRGGRRYQQVFSRGRPLAPLTELGPSSSRGTTFYLVPDPAIFDAILPARSVRSELEALAALNPDLAVTLNGERLPDRGGLLGLAAHLAGPDVERQLHVRVQQDGIEVEVAACWGRGRATARGLVDLAPAEGAHLDGALDALASTPRAGRALLVSLRSEDRRKPPPREPEIRTLVRGAVARALTDGAQLV